MKQFKRDQRLWAHLARFAAGHELTDSSEMFQEVANFGDNPGNLRMFEFVPPDRRHPLPLVVVLHGCKQNAKLYAAGAGWRALAAREGFHLLLPQQQPSNNQNLCFNWFRPSDARRNRGEAQSIRSMIDHTTSSHSIDSGRIFVTGLSAGGAMTSVMLATYPEVFARGAPIAGLPFGAADDVQEALDSMFRCPPRSSPVLGDLVRTAAPRPPRWPRIAVWHGSADRTVIPAKADEIIKQWTDVWGLPQVASCEDAIDGVSRQRWLDEDGKIAIERVTVSGLAHGMPIDLVRSRDGEASAFIVDAGIQATEHIARFFGLTDIGGAIPVSFQAITPKARSREDGETIVTPNKRGIGGVIADALRRAGLTR